MALTMMEQFFRISRGARLSDATAGRYVAATGAVAADRDIAEGRASAEGVD